MGVIVNRDRSKRRVDHETYVAVTDDVGHVRPAFRQF